ncbi:MAG: helix-turn-helix transcriptional regulator [Desulfatitalea sp.]|nr:helix-turn-helix transcriptional regulator [Desulfatitalea sp.]NNJ98883.1 helix-turn-helix transcriptional regulator [Desulfatitalea sp.]
MEIAALIKEGLRSKEIADILFISEHAVSFHRQSIRKKLGLHNKCEKLEDALKQLS